MTPKDSLLKHELKQSKPFRHPGEESIMAVRRTADALRREMGRTIDDFGITEQQYNVLRILRGSRVEGLPTLEIGERMIERQSDVTRLVDRLEKRGLVRRRRSTEDRRVVRCWISEAGLELLGEMDGPVNETDDRVAARLSGAEHERLIELLERLRTPG